MQQSVDILCPACGARARRKWEYCARCGESLEDALPASSIPPKIATERPRATTPASGGGAVLAAAGVVLVAITVTAWLYARSHVGSPSDGLAWPSTRIEPAPSPTPIAGLEPYRAGRQLMREGRPDAAADRFAEAVSVAASNGQYRIGHAEALWWSGDREASLAEYAEAARLSRTYEGEYLRVLELADRREDAVRFCEDTLSSQPERADVRGLLADLLYRQGDYAGALPHYEALATLSPRDPTLLVTLGYALQQSGEAERAVSVFRQALDVAPRDALLRSHLAEGLYDTGAVREAIEVVQQGMDSGANPAPALHKELGSLLERSGRRVEAAKAYAAYAKLAPDAQDSPAIAARAERLGRGGPS